MKFLITLAAAASLAFFAGSCERHSWEDSKSLFKPHEDHADHDEDHKKDGETGEKKADSEQS